MQTSKGNHVTRSFARIVLSAALITATASVAAAQAAPGSASSDEWTFTVAPYLVAAGMSGDIDVKGYGSTVDMSASDVFSHLKAGFMGYFSAKKDGWGLAADTVYAKLGDTVTQGPLTIEPTVSTGLYTLLGTRRLSPIADLIFGVRVTSVSTTLSLTSPVQKQYSDSKTWVDPVVGVNVGVPVGAKGKISIVADIGGFGAASTISVDVLPTVQFRVARHAWLAAGYRYIYDDYSDGAGFLYKVAMQGPAFGLVMPF
jgi:hypothetical protein